MKRFVLDTNLYIAADRDLTHAAALERFVTAFLSAERVTLITANGEDFERIRRVHSFALVAPWPA